MAVEAMFQKYSALNPEKAVRSVNELACKLQNIRFDRALVAEERKVCAIILTLSKVPGHEFRISTSKDDVPTPFTLWYKAQREAGMGFGPSLKKVISLEATSGERSCRAMFDLTSPPSKWDSQSFYPFHPAVLDACLQVAMPANASNERSLVNDVIFPGIVNEVIQSLVWHEHRTVYDPETGAMFMQVKWLNYVKLGVVLKPDAHTFDKVVWKPDVTVLTPEQLTNLSSDNTLDTKLDVIVDLLAHKKPMLSVLEVNLSPVFFIQRVIPYTEVNTFKRAEDEGSVLVVKSLFGTETMARIRAIDLSYTKHVNLSMVEKLLAEIFELGEARHVNAIHPIIEYGFDNVPAALAYIRGGQHIGKIIITNHGGDVQVPIRPALQILQLRPDASYLVVGGLKGLCGSPAIHMARHGIKHIVVCNRSGTGDDASARVIRSCLSYGRRITKSSGDVGD
ncbi:putative polyketide synthase [Rosellinia necatrix]|uniref:Putative polyketide synthase n=1 Tax=Rosellinia necatrix TaxID=77044 RepID=A0A1W2TQ77_ROSNE|nr:putative polyketide synthase [Rosellinia necatrix]